MLELLWPTTCAACGRRGASPCRACIEELRPAPGLVAPPGLSSCRALLVYEGAGRALVTGLKYRNQRTCVAVLADAMGAVGIADRPDLRVDGVTWPPTSPARRRARGFDQAELLARAVARVWRLPCRRLVARRSSGSQTGRTLAARLDGPAFEVTRAAWARPAWASIVVVDDVLTSGATLSAAARALLGWGAHEVHGLVAAYTPGPTSVDARAAQGGAPPRRTSVVRWRDLDNRGTNATH